MKKFKPTHNTGNGPEAIIQRSVTTMLLNKGWYVKRIPASALLSGIPDLFVTHSRYGHRWVEIKLPEMRGSQFTIAQLDEFPKICANGSGVWILTGATENEYGKLFTTANFHEYLILKRLKSRGV